MTEKICPEHCVPVRPHSVQSHVPHVIMGWWHAMVPMTAIRTLVPDVML